jgi:hypothetical protein
MIGVDGKGDKAPRGLRKKQVRSDKQEINKSDGSKSKVAKQ